MALLHSVGRGADRVVLDDRADRIEQLDCEAGGIAVLSPGAQACDVVAFARVGAADSVVHGRLAVANPAEDADALHRVPDDNVVARAVDLDEAARVAFAGIRTTDDVERRVVKFDTGLRVAPDHVVRSAAKVDAGVVEAEHGAAHVVDEVRLMPDHDLGAPLGVGLAGESGLGCAVNDGGVEYAETQERPQYRASGKEILVQPLTLRDMEPNRLHSRGVVGGQRGLGQRDLAIGAGQVRDLLGAAKVDHVFGRIHKNGLSICCPNCQNQRQGPNHGDCFPEHLKPHYFQKLSACCVCS